MAQSVNGVELGGGDDAGEGVGCGGAFGGRRWRRRGSQGMKQTLRASEREFELIFLIRAEDVQREEGAQEFLTAA